ncbi:hypothetical protein HgNV_037 [Homarus gammarus nudivirus]|uniref:Uncharacterized protein n=1 Tax=Homarus gammarus nudivirus TaxID=2509616 RepID=A0A411HB74_9VIRU|nr:hypothetical protein KM727_gp37 [Homarus gammarus nudivirus]QBB28642.1 hypothetical protein HgNV_037 [Homarus gammarus nudivirus]
MDNMVNEIIKKTTLLNMDSYEIEINRKFVRQLGIHVVLNMISDNYEFISLEEIVPSTHILCLDSVLKINIENLQDLMCDLDSFISGKDSMQRIYSQRK